MTAIYQSFISYRGARYLWLSLTLCLGACIAYLWHQPIGSANGGTWLGYTLGTIGAVLIVWLMLLGMRKRSYTSELGTVQGWTSAHVYLGTSLLIIATLHSGFQFGLNVHTLAYALMTIVIVSGFYGIYAYLHYPSLMAENRAGESLQQLLDQVSKIDERCMREANTDDLQQLVQSAINGCSLGGGWWRQLKGGDASTVNVPANLAISGASGTQSNVDQRTVIGTLAHLLSSLSGGEASGRVQNLLASFAAKQVLLRRLRRDVQIRARLKLWLYIHVPLSFALLAALLVHIIVVFYYW